MKITPGLNRRLHQLLSKTKLTEQKTDLVKEYTNGRESSSKELRYNEALALIRHLEDYEKTFQKSKTASQIPAEYAYEMQELPTSEGQNSRSFLHEIPTSDELKNMSADKMRKKIIGLLREIGFEQWSPDRKKMVADMDRIYSYIKEVGYLGKDLNKYTQNELPKLVSNIESIYVKELKKKSKQ